jgi:SAM-dependent methyltransferase
VVARLSALTDPFFSEALRTSTRGRGPIHVLDVGCGSGTHLKRMSEHNAEATGVGIDLDPAVVRSANANLQSWGLAGRFHALEGDAVATEAREAAGPFDLITLLNVIYYFPVEERTEVLSRLRARLRPGGELLVACTMVEPGRRNMWAANLDLATRSMIGCEPLSKPCELCSQLEAAGFAQVRMSRIIPGGSVFALRATSSPANPPGN